MSFILDALKKSETERQQQGAAEFSATPVSADNPKAPKWLWILAALLAINLLVLAGILLWPDTRSQTPVTPDPGTTTESLAAEPILTDTVVEATFAEQVAEAKTRQSVADKPPAAATAPPQRAATVVQMEPVVSAPYMRTFDEVRVQGLLQSVDLHLDIHVYSDLPADRFVFINMVKHREQSRLAEGPIVSEITPDGVILDYQGTAFLLPRD